MSMNRLGNLSAVQTLAEDVETATDAVAKALEVVKQLSKDVKAGVVPSSDLEQAIIDLQLKAKRAETLSKAAKGLDGFSGGSTINPLWIMLGLGAFYVLVLRPK